MAKSKKSNTVLYVILVILLAGAIGVALYFLLRKKSENYINVPLTRRVERVAKYSPQQLKAMGIQQNPECQTAAGQVYSRDMGEGFFEVPGNFQSLLSPRFSNVDYGAHLRCQLPAYGNMATPNNPMSYYGDLMDMAPAQIKETFKAGTEKSGKEYDGGDFGNAGKVNDMLGKMVNNSSYGPKMNDYRANAQGQVKQQGCVSDMVRDQQQYVEAVDLLPVSDMSSGVLTEGGEGLQPIVYDRFMYANQKSKLYGRGDYIRGDLPIVPISPSEQWFRPSVYAHIDLNTGAMAAMGGVDNVTNRDLLALQSASAGNINSDNYGSGINYVVEKGNYLGAAQNDVVVTSFP